MIELCKILKVYDTKPVLNNLDLTIQQGEYVAITGESGCGKTTLLNIIGLIDSKYNGNYYFEGVKDPTIKSRKGIDILRNRIGFIFQNFALIEDMTIEQNFKIVSKYNKSNITMEEALKEVGLDGFKDKKVYHLSGGEQQRVAIAKLICKGSDVILADEPTCSLDEKNRDIILDILDKMNKDGKTVIVVTHDSNVIERAKRVVRLEV